MALGCHLRDNAKRRIEKPIQKRHIVFHTAYHLQNGLTPDIALPINVCVLGNGGGAGKVGKWTKSTVLFKGLGLHSYMIRFFSTTVLKGN